MPITPFHFGPGVLLTAASPRRFSWTMFVLANVIMDLEPISWFLLTGHPAHMYFHTYVGAALLGLVVGLWGRSLCEWTLRGWNARLSLARARWLEVAPTISPMVAIASALVGTLSHVFLDSIMHADIRPWWPFSEANGLRGAISTPALEWLCVASGVLGIVSLVARRRDAAARLGVAGDANPADMDGQAPSTGHREKAVCIYTGETDPINGCLIRVGRKHRENQ